ncbi:iron-containing alcohol dehydrogenase [Glaciecola petra]|uniref:Iron-containing alcohol dehydrogenase n=1 Tax=Glaciecola petra TaxID=3075602 RepID=A0ABU2ZQY3_9ALTE|nr:iron-containing alcohol dehydrogenase [Aestuariibacter sp. P117]MDT0595037.1 iron-containing alcohol dehydrogenase [Aestuariibacter sp. P117]
MSVQIKCPRFMQVGKNAHQQVCNIMIDMGCKKPLIITDKTMVELGYVNQIKQQFNNDFKPLAVFDETIPEPTETSIKAAVELVKQGQFDCLIAIGGGSPIDSAKAISVLSVFGGEMQDYKFPHIQKQSGLPIIAIPTTAGTGSEVTKFTIITDQDTDEKMLCAGPAYVPAAAIIDYTLTLSLPPRTTADTGIDALTHAIEAYVSKKANPFSDSQALAAMKQLAPNLRTVFTHGDNEAAREAMMLGSCLAGLAFSSASVALVHGMSRPIGALFHVPHGLSNAMLLPSVTEFSVSAAPKRYAECARAMGLATTETPDETAIKLLLSELKALNHDLHVPTPEQYGIDRASFFEKCTIMAEQAIESGSPGNNPRIASVEQMVAIYRRLWE